MSDVFVPEYDPVQISKNRTGVEQVQCFLWWCLCYAPMIFNSFNSSHSHSLYPILLCPIFSLFPFLLYLFFFSHLGVSITAGKARGVSAVVQESCR